jgi:hypothetical protein
MHSVLASKQAKDTVRRLAGPRYRNGLYRIGFVIQSLITVGWTTIWFVRLPDRQLYHLRPPWSLFLRLGQLASLALLLSGVRVIGLFQFLGIPNLRSFLAGETPDPEPEAQGPPLGSDGEVVIAGGFRYTRHPDNLPVLGVFLLWPRMTVNRATLAALMTVYAILGSLHEEYRLHNAYGEAYQRYQRMVPFFLPRRMPADTPYSAASSRDLQADQPPMANS